jgi:hypothetical protein
MNKKLLAAMRYAVQVARGQGVPVGVALEFFRPRGIVHGRYPQRSKTAHTQSIAGIRGK